MSEEQTYLMRSGSDSEYCGKTTFGTLGNKHKMAYGEEKLTVPGSPGNQSPDAVPETADHGEGDIGELIDNQTSVLSQFHHDTIDKISVSYVQARVVICCGLALLASAAELAAIPFVLPSAEIELCIRPHEKSWLVMISLIGLAIGSVGYGSLASTVGRRRALMSALAVNLVFAVIAAFMPTYGTVMCARFCSAIGSGGIIPCSISLVMEWCKQRYLSAGSTLLWPWYGLGILYVSGVAAAILPHTGIHALIDDKEHFSAWHRFLLVCALPILFALIGMIWVPESPRFLLEVGREVEAITLYQQMHQRVKYDSGSTAASEYRVAELRIPSKRVKQTGVQTLWRSYFDIFSSYYRSTTFSIAGVLVVTMAIRFYLSSYIPTMVLKMENEKFEASKRVVANATFDDQIYNTTLENIEYLNVTFNNCSFRDTFMSHVTFQNCSFYDVTFANVKTSYTTFKGSLFVRSTLIDTDIEASRDLDPSCVLNSSMIRGMDAKCPRDLSFSLLPLYMENIAVGVAYLIGGVMTVLPGKWYTKVTVVVNVMCAILSPSIYLAESETTLHVIEAIYITMLALIFFMMSVMIVQSYPVTIRCTVHGVIMAFVYISALLSRGVGELYTDPLVASIVVCLLAVLNAAVATKLRSSSAFLL